MRTSQALFAIALWGSWTLASEVQIVPIAIFHAQIHKAYNSVQTQDSQNRQQCNGMYSKRSWGGDVDPFILTKFTKATPEGDEDPLVSLVMFEWRDEDLVGVWPSPDAAKVGKIYLLGESPLTAGRLIERIHLQRQERAGRVL